MITFCLAHVSVVVIGHNESKNLEKCFIALQEMDYPREKLEIIYVDSNSTDDSIMIAKKYADQIIAEKKLWHTAGLARNLGIQAAKYDYLHFVDGDIQIDKNYLLKAIRCLISRSDIVAVTGYYSETSQSFWNRLLNFRRDDGTELKEGYTTNTSGGGTYIKAPLLEIDGYDERIKKGQESELGSRMIAQGYKIWFLPIYQGKHNFDINSLYDMIKRFWGDGRSLGYVLLLSLREPQNRFIMGYRKSALKILIQHSLILIAILLGFVVNPIITYACFVLYFLNILRGIAFKRGISYKYRLYKLTVAFFAPASYVGMIWFFSRYAWLKIRGIELIQEKMKLKQDIRV